MGADEIPGDDGTRGRARKFGYPRREVIRGYLRAGAGLLLTLFPLILGRPGMVGATVLGVIALTFAIYGIRTWLRGRGVIGIDDQGIFLSGPLRKAVRWEALTDVRLSYYSTRQDKSSGWMQLNVTDGLRKLKIESTLEGFKEVVARVIGEARRRGIELSPTTRNNLRPLGLSVDGE